jgi:hypothetical protein
LLTTYVRARLCKLQKGCTRLAAANDNIYKLFARGRWFSSDAPASSTTKTGRHDITEILIKQITPSKKGGNRCAFDPFNGVEFKPNINLAKASLVYFLNYSVANYGN